MLGLSALQAKLRPVTRGGADSDAAVGADDLERVELPFGFRRAECDESFIAQFLSPKLMRDMRQAIIAGHFATWQSEFFNTCGDT